MTEDEAKTTKWCPMTRTRPALEGERLRENCIGSGCMMWRWRLVELLAGDGYCGLAGRPEIAP